MTEAGRIRQLSTKSLPHFARAIEIPGTPSDRDNVPLTDREKEHPAGESEVREWDYIRPGKPLVTHHLLLLQLVDALVANELKDANGRVADGVMAMMPPGAAKSTYLDVVAPTGLMGRIPGYQVLLTGYGSDILGKHARRARTVCQSAVYKGLFGTTIRSDHRAVQDWKLTNGSEYMSGGILSGLTGNRCDLLIGDDLVQGRQAAESERTRDTTWDAYIDDATSRLKPYGKQFLVGTRWHEADVLGRILPEDWDGESGFIIGRDGRLWYVVCLEAQCTRDDDPLGRKVGEYLWPEWFPESHWQPFKINPRTWNSLFQQRPTSDQGTIIKKEWLIRHKSVPADIREGMNVYISLDSAESDGSGDFTFIIVWGYDVDGKSWTLDIWYGQVETDVWVDELIDRIINFKPLALVPDKDNIWKAVEPFFKKELLRRSKKEGHSVRCPVHTVSHGGMNKPLRMQSFAGMAHDGQISIQDDGYGEHLVSQLVKFPTGTYDDGADCCAAYGRHVDRMYEQTIIKEEVILEVPTEEMVIEPLYSKKKQQW